MLKYTCQINNHMKLYLHTADIKETVILQNRFKVNLESAKPVELQLELIELRMWQSSLRLS